VILTGKPSEKFLEGSPASALALYTAPVSSHFSRVLHGPAFPLQSENLKFEIASPGTNPNTLPHNSLSIYGIVMIHKVS